ncbi:MAG: hypothetical protein JSU70_21225 [Phycisphaerales bacterium]|nr:MAG: hypothetical protein JSU70_21225 [Phycisphaerales bacterium]
MVDEETMNEVSVEAENETPRISKLAIASTVFGLFGPFYCGAMWILSLNDFFAIPSAHVVALFACGGAWILGILLGKKSLEQIENSEGQLIGREYAVVGVVISTAWMLLILVVVLLPALHSVNS